MYKIRRLIIFDILSKVVNRLITFLLKLRIIIGKGGLNMRKIKIIVSIASLAIIIAITFIIKANFYKINSYSKIINNSKVQQSLKVEKVIINNDKNNDGILDLDEIVLGAKADVENKPVYTNKYYVGGYPPDNEGVCTDVVWRSLKKAGYNFKDLIDKDIKENVKAYPRVEGKPDPNIDFRRVPNLVTFFNRNGQVLTKELKPNDPENLKQWQGGDIVTFDQPQHVVIISDKRRNDGVPLIIHNPGPYTVEEDKLIRWIPKITGHFRFPK